MGRMVKSESNALHIISTSCLFIFSEMNGPSRRSNRGGAGGGGGGGAGGGAPQRSFTNSKFG